MANGIAFLILAVLAIILPLAATRGRSSYYDRGEGRWGRKLLLQI